MVIVMYNTEDKYLFEILDDYKTLDNKDEIFNCFMKRIWRCKNSRQIKVNYIKFTMLPELIDTSVGQVFYQYMNIPYYSSKTKSSKTDYINLIRQKINNIYNNYCDTRLCTRKDYMDLLHTPKVLYYRMEKGKEEYDVLELKEKLESNLQEADRLKEMYAKQKMDLSWKEFKPIIGNILRKSFDNYIPLDDFEDKTTFVLDTDIWSEDNFIIRYFCKCLQHGIKDYQKKYYGLYRKGKRSKLTYARCTDCGKMFWINKKASKTIRCPQCQDLANYTPIETKIIKCIDCGKEVEVDAKDNKTIRCPQCQDLANYTPIET